MATQRLIKALNVAEKASVARQISFTLGYGSRSVPSLSKFNPIYRFECATEQLKAEMRFTSVRGHLQDLAYVDPALKFWHQYDPKLLITQPIHQKNKPDVSAILQNLQKEADSAEMLILWLDCDLEGQAIAKQVQEACLSANPKLEVRRARFSALTRSDLWRAINNLTALDQNQVKAVHYRQQLDLRIGCTLTNFQTLAIQNKFDLKTNGPLSYGTCQIPLLALIVDDFVERKDFKPVKYWEIDLCCVVPTKPEEQLWFLWSNPRIEKIEEAQSRYASFPSEEIQLQIAEVASEQCKKLRPLPFTTSTLLKLGTTKLKTSSSDIMTAAETLYRQGLISYPRTETNRFHPSINLTNSVTELLKYKKFQPLAQRLLEKGVNPRLGKQNDHAHSPIYPTKCPGDTLEPLLAGLYDMITQNFLLCLSEDAEYEKKTVTIVKDDMKFTLQANDLTKEGYLAYTSAEKFKARKLPPLKQGDTLTLKRLKMHTKLTPEPPKLTESLLITKMEQNKIGTDSTIHEHISNIQERGYANKNNDEFAPTKLGIGLVNAYREIDSELCNTRLRAEMEANVKGIAQGKLDYQKSLDADLKQFEGFYSKLEASREKFLEGFNKVFKAEVKSSGSQSESVETEYKCNTCDKPMIFTSERSSRRLECTGCKRNFAIPQKGMVTPTGKKCPECDWEVLDISDRPGAGYNICPCCFNAPKPHMMASQSSPKLPCFKCLVGSCQLSAEFKEKGIGGCPNCKEGRLRVKPGKGALVIGCSSYPKCKQFMPLSNKISKVWMTVDTCPDCAANGITSQLCEVTMTVPSGKITKKVCLQRSCIDPSLKSEIA